MPQNRVTTLAFNQRANGWEPLCEADVRRALSMAIGKERIAESVLRGYGEPVSTFQPAGSAWYAEEALEGVFETLSAERPVDFLVSQDAIVGYHRSIVGPREAADGDRDRQTWHAGGR